MTSKEAMIYQLKKLKGKPLKQKLEHILTYFWIPVLAMVAILGVTLFNIVQHATAKNPGLMVTCINAYAEYEQMQSYMMEFARQSDISPDKYELSISTNAVILDDDPMGSYDSIQMLNAQIAAQAIDVMVSDPQILSWYFYQDVFADLTQVLSPEHQAEYEQYYLYMDMAFLRELETYPEGRIEYPDPTKPELMTEPVAVALLLSGNKEFQQLCYPHNQGEVAVGILFNSLNISNALAFLDYIMK